MISPSRGSGGEKPFTLRNQIRAVGEGQPNGTAWRLTKDRVSSRGDEKIGLSNEQCREAERIAREDNESGAVSDAHYRMVRNKPLLMIHSLEPKRKLDKNPIAAFGISFPYGDYSTTVQVVANQIWLRAMQGQEDNPGEEEDFDA